jgi:hypothetical protein
MQVGYGPNTGQKAGQLGHGPLLPSLTVPGIAAVDKHEKPGPIF